MKFRLVFASQMFSDKESEVELSTLEELEDLVYSLPPYEMFKNDRAVIVSFNKMTITVYDSYIE